MAPSTTGQRAPACSTTEPVSQEKSTAQEQSLTKGIKLDSWKKCRGQSAIPLPHQSKETHLRILEVVHFRIARPRVDCASQTGHFLLVRACVAVQISDVELVDVMAVVQSAARTVTLTRKGRT